MDSINKKFEALLAQLQNGSVKNVNKLFTEMIEKLSSLISSQGLHNTNVNKSLSKLISINQRNFVKDYISILEGYEAKAINLSLKKNVAEILSILSGIKNSSDVIKTITNSRIDPVIKKALSDRVWNINKGFYKNLDIVLKSGLLEGAPAHEVKIQLTRLLNTPEKLDINELRRRGIEKAGGEKKYRQLEKKILNYHPGQGVYKSSKKNAFRLARTEINRAYRSQDVETRKSLPFVVGIEVKLSASHPKLDICDDMQGQYPKDFSFLGWHPACLCYTVPILATKDEAAKLIAGKDIDIKRIETIPKRAETYIKDRAEKINNMNVKPFFIDENKDVFGKLLEN